MEAAAAALVAGDGRGGARDGRTATLQMNGMTTKTNGSGAGGDKAVALLDKDE